MFEDEIDTRSKYGTGLLAVLNFAGRSKPLPYNASAQFLLLDKFEFVGEFEDEIDARTKQGTGVLVPLNFSGRSKPLPYNDLVLRHFALSV